MKSLNFHDCTWSENEEELKAILKLFPNLKELSLTAFVGLTVIIVVGIRFRWHIRYLFFLLKLRRGGYKLQVNDEEESWKRKYDAFVVYNEHDGDEWCYFEMRMAQTQLFEEKKDVILMVMLQEIPDDMMPRVLRKILMTKKYLEWPENDLGRRMFWQKLRMALM
ncbi:toll-like receptor 2 type-2 [Ptychodera flava]|uniref:toll-like receptor 2 type-2 n=1 Tax=Ptychodera flava TaxID=63121 RepID=UPI00396A3754